jgi:predicted amidophosphoribosyltransferase
LIAGGLRHGGAARRLVHRLKYQGLVEIADLLAGFMIPLVPAAAEVLVPVARARLRKLRHGIDPALELTRALSRSTGLPVDRALAAALWWPRHAPTDPARRSRPQFRARGAPIAGAVLVDDVATSGATLVAAAAALDADLRHGIVATAPGRVRVPAPTEAGEVAWRFGRT